MDTRSVAWPDVMVEPPGVGLVTFKASGSSSAPPEVVYATLVDIRTGLVWGGAQQHEKSRLLTMDAPEGEAAMGTEWDSTGSDPMGSFADHSVVTVADRPSLFEFRTEGHYTWKKRYGRSVTLVIHRWEIAPEGTGSRVRYLFRATGPVPMPRWLRVPLKTPGVRQVMLRTGPARDIRRGLDNLLRLAVSRAR
jgi:hypothetical protein